MKTGKNKQETRVGVHIRQKNQSVNTRFGRYASGREKHLVLVLAHPAHLPRKQDIYVCLLLPVFSLLF
jgi:hypothetical protein